MASVRPWLLIAAALVVIAIAGAGWQQERASATGSPEITLNVSPSGHCDDLLAPTKCTNPTGKQFQLLIDVAIPPPGGYEGFQVRLLYGNLIYKAKASADEVVWPDEAINVRSPVVPTGREGFVLFHASTSGGGGGPLSNHAGTILVLNLTCPANVGSTAIDLVAGTIADTGFLLPGFVATKPTSLALNCETLPAFTPTPTPTGPTAIPTATQTPVPTPSGPPEMSLNVKGGDCDHPTKPSKCTVVTGASFTLSIAANNIPPEGYVGLQTQLYHGALLYKPAGIPDDEIIWPDSVLAVRSFIDFQDTVSHGAVSGFGPYPVSTYLGNINQLKMNCTATPDSIELAMPVFDQAVFAQLLGSMFVAAGLDGTQGASVPVAVIGQRDIPGLGVDIDVGALLEINCVAPTPTPTPTPTPESPSVQKSPQLSNLFLTAQGAKVPPTTCLGGTDGVALTQAMDTKVGGLDKAGDLRQLGGFSFKVNYDETKVCVVLSPGPLAQRWLAGGGTCIIQDSVTKPTLQGSATIVCVRLGKAPLSPPASDNLTLAQVIVRPMPDEYSVMRPNNGNGNVVQIINKACKLTGTQGDPIAPPPGSANCTDADITMRYLEGDVVPDCEVDTLDTQASAFRWGAQKGTLLYNDFFNTEPSKPQQDDDIDINDLQLVYGRFGSTCANPHPEQAPVNPKAG